MRYVNGLAKTPTERHNDDFLKILAPSVPGNALKTGIENLKGVGRNENE